MLLIKRKITTRNARLEDAPLLNDLDHQVWQEGSQTNLDMWKSRILTFSEGIIVALNDNKIIGVIVVELLNNYDFKKPQTWYEVTDNGLLKNKHCNNGKIMYGVALSVDPKWGNKGIGTKLAKKILKLIIEKNIQYVILGARMMNYSKFKRMMTPNEYIKVAFSGKNKSLDPELTFYKKIYFKPITIIQNYFHDPGGDDYGALIKLNNPFFNNPLRFIVIPFLNYIL